MTKQELIEKLKTKHNDGYGEPCNGAWKCALGMAIELVQQLDEPKECRMEWGEIITQCNLCGECVDTDILDNIKNLNYCPNCGAKCVVQK